MTTEPRAVSVRPETSADRKAIDAVLDAAFGRKAEGALVAWLRESGDLIVGLVAEEADRTIVGYVGFIRLQVEGPAGTTPAVALVPLAAAPARQRQGVGTALLNEGLARLTQAGETLVFVLGDPAYYRRFGFAVDAAEAFESPYAGSHFMVRPLSQNAPREGRVRYPSAFAELG